MSNWVKYQNGNYSVALDLETGTKIRENDLNHFITEFPESADVKITNRCTNPLQRSLPPSKLHMGNCPFCHENSTCDGKHSDALHSPIWDSFHPYTEISLGGGNVLEYPDLIPLLKRLKSLKLIPSITLHQTHFESNFELVKKLSDQKLIYGLGVSLKFPSTESSKSPEFVEKMKQFPNGVVHVINGMVYPYQLYRLAYNNIKILILGYKNVNRGSKLYHTNIGYSIDKRKNLLYNTLEKILEERWFPVVSFDNLAIQQLKPQRFVSEEYWETCYMGDDGVNGELTSASMYIDLVENEFAKNSCAVNNEYVHNRYKIENRTVTEMYQFLKTQ